MEILPSFSEDDYSFLRESSYYLDTLFDPNQVQPAIGESYTHIGQLALIEKDLVKLASDHCNQINEDTYDLLLNLRQQKISSKIILP